MRDGRADSTVLLFIPAFQKFSKTGRASRGLTIARSVVNMPTKCVRACASCPQSILPYRYD